MEWKSMQKNQAADSDNTIKTGITVHGQKLKTVH